VAALSFTVMAGTRPAAAQSTWNGATSVYNTGTNWTPNTAPVSAGQSAIFSNTGTTAVNVSAAVSPDSWTFNSSSQSYAITGQSVTFGGGGIVNNANAGQVISIGNIIGGAGAVQQNGNSTLQLSGANTYTGGTVITAGTLQLTGAGPGIGDVGGTTTISGGVLDFEGNQYQQATLNQSGGTVQNGGIEVNTYKLTGGTLASGAAIIGNPLIATSTFDLESGTVNGGLFGANNVQLVKTTAGTVTLASFNDYLGGTIIKAGTLQLTGAGTLGHSTGATTISGGTLDLGTTTQTQASLSQSGGTLQNGTLHVGTYQLTGGTLAANAVVSASTTFDMQAGTVNGVLAGAGQLRKSTAGTVTLSAANSYTGGTVISAGTLALSGAGTLGATANGTAISGGTLDLGGSTQTQASLSQSGGTVQNGAMNVGSYLLTGGTLAATAFVSASTTFDMQAGTVNGVLAGAGQLQKSTAGTVTLTGVNTYTGGTAVTGGLINFNAANNFGSGAITLNGGGLQWASGTSIDISSRLTALGSGGATFDTNANKVTLGSSLSGTGGLSKTGAGTLTLSAVSNYTGATTVNGGALVVNGSIASSSLTTVNAGGTLAGIGTVGALTVNSGGVFAPGPLLGSPQNLTVAGNLAFQSGAIFLVQVTPATASLAIVNGNASIAGTVNALFSPGSYMQNNYTILAATGTRTGTFSDLVTTDLPVGFTASLHYGANNVALDVTAAIASAGGSGTSQGNVAATVNNAFNNGSALPPGFVTLFGLTGANLNAALTQVSGETATGSQQTTYSAMSQFMGTLLDHLIGTDGSASTSGATPYVEASADAGAHDFSGEQRSNYERDAYGMITKVAPRNPVFDPHWSAWTAGFGGSQTTDGSAALGSNTATSRVFGMAAGADYWLSPNTIGGFALAGGGTSFSVANGGTGRSDLFQAGAFIKHTAGAAYVSGAVAYGWQDITTDRTVTIAGIDRLHAQFNANAYSGRVESGYRFATPWMGITPYAAGQFTAFDLPAYAETALVGTNTFALAYAARNVTDTRSELGIRTDKSFAMQNAILTLGGRFAWAHDFNPDRGIATTFQALPGASFVVNGAAQASDSALTTASAEMKWINGWAAAATFEGEFSDVTRSYAGKGVVRYAW
jgi:autotransporter-associated beta strand protein